MPKNVQIQFALRSIETIQFATIKDSYNKDKETDLQTSVGVNITENKSVISIHFEVSFLSEKKPFVVLEVVCHFDVEQKAYKKFENNGAFTIPVGFCQHLAVITAGTARGVLYEKLKDTPYNEYILPTVNLTKIITEDVVLIPNKEKSAK